MADGTKIEWTDATWNVVNGCSVTSPGCTNCYAMKLAGTRLRHHPTREGLTQPGKAGPVWNGKVRFNDDVLTEPLHWKRPRKIFVCAHGDLFHENVPDEWIDRVFAVMALAPQHTFQVLTKRSARMRAYMRTLNRGERHVAAAAGRMGFNVEQVAAAVWPDSGSTLANVWLGVSVEDQARADERIPDLLATPAAVRWISAEPLLGPVNLRELRSHYQSEDRPLLSCDALTGVHSCGPSIGHEGERLDWVVAGGESGLFARPMHPDWARSLRDQCAAAGVAFSFKQWGEWVIADQSWIPHHGERNGDFWRVGKKRAGRLLDGVLHDGFPA